MGSESKPHEKAEWAIDSEAMGNNYCFSKIQLVGQKNIETKHLKQDFNPFLPPKRYIMAGTF